MKFSMEKCKFSIIGRNSTKHSQENNTKHITKPYCGSGHKLDLNLKYSSIGWL